MNQPTYSDTSLWNDLSDILDQHDARFRELLRSVEEWLDSDDPELPDEPQRGGLRSYLQLVSELATSLEQSGRFLRPMGRVADVDPDALGETVKLLRMTQLLEDSVKLRLARSIVGDIDAAAERCVALLPALIHGEIDVDSERYLEFVSRSYIAGHHTEAVILARSVLDTAFRDRISNVQVYAAFELKPSRFPKSHHEPLRKGYPPTLVDRIVTAEILGQLHHSSNARMIKTRGDKAVHGEITPDDALDTIHALAQVLADLR